MLIKNKYILFKRIICLAMVFTFTLTTLPAQALAQGAGLFLPAPGAIVPLSPGFTPAIVRGLRVYPNNPLQFDFIVDSGDSGLEGDLFKAEAEKLIRYFLASLTIPEQDLWVNLSPYEADRIVPDELGQTEMGIDLLAQDYLLKQITASLISPDHEIGKKFWEKIYAKAYEQYGTTHIDVDTFNKVWIVPEKALIYEHKDKAFVAESKLKVMLEEDYFAQQNSRGSVIGVRDSNNENRKPKADNQITSSIIRTIILPALEHEVNFGQNFAQLRQIYHSLILAHWYKTALKDSILNKVYSDQRKVKGLELAYSVEQIADSQDLNAKPYTLNAYVDEIYSQYLDAFKQGVHDMIRVEYDPHTQKHIPRKYFSGGFGFEDFTTIAQTTKDLKVGDQAMTGFTPNKIHQVSFAASPSFAQDSAMIISRDLFFSTERQKEYYRDFVSVVVNALAAAKEMIQTPLGQRGERRQELRTKYLLSDDLADRLDDVADYMIQERYYSEENGFSVEAIQAMAGSLTDFYEEFRNIRAEADILFEIASHPDLRVDKKTSGVLKVTLKYLEHISKGEKSFDQIYEDLSFRESAVKILLLKWLGNMADTNENIAYQEKARNFLENYVERFLNDNRDILEAYAEMFFSQFRESVEIYGEESLRAVVMFTGAQLLGEWVKAKAKLLGEEVVFRDLLLTVSMFLDKGLERDMENPVLGLADINFFATYLEENKIFEPSVKHLIFIDTGFQGTINKFLSEIFELKGITRDYLLLSHHGPGSGVKAHAFGLEDSAQWNFEKKRLYEFTQIIDDGFEAETLSPLRLSEDRKPIDNLSTPRPWFHNLARQKIISLAERTSSGPKTDSAQTASLDEASFQRSSSKAFSGPSRRDDEMAAGKMMGMTWPGRLDFVYQQSIEKLKIIRAEEREKLLRLAVIGIGEKGAPTVFDLGRILSGEGFKNVIIYGIDNNKSFVDDALKEMPNHPQSGIQYKFILENMFDLKNIEHSVDMVIATNILDWYYQSDDRDRAISALREILSSEGFLVRAGMPQDSADMIRYHIYDKERGEIEKGFWITDFAQEASPIQDHSRDYQQIIASSIPPGDINQATGALDELVNRIVYEMNNLSNPIISSDGNKYRLLMKYEKGRDGKFFVSGALTDEQKNPLGKEGFSFAVRKQGSLFSIEGLNRYLDERIFGTDLTNKGIGKQFVKILMDALPPATPIEGQIFDDSTLQWLRQNFEATEAGQVFLKAKNGRILVVDNPHGIKPILRRKEMDIFIINPAQQKEVSLSEALSFSPKARSLGTKKFQLVASDHENGKPLEKSKELEGIAALKEFLLNDDGFPFIITWSEQGLKNLETGFRATGGIDLTRTAWDVEVEGEGIAFDIPEDILNMDPAQIQGFVPVIINITPVTNFHFLLGLEEIPDTLQLSSR